MYVNLICINSSFSSSSRRYLDFLRRNVNNTAISDTPVASYNNTNESLHGRNEKLVERKLFFARYKL